MFAEPVPELSFCYPSGKVLRLFASNLTTSVGVVLMVISHRARLVNFCQELKLFYLDLELENWRTLRSAKSVHSEKSEN